MIGFMTVKNLLTEEEIRVVLDCVEMASYEGFWRWFGEEEVHIRSFIKKLGLDDEEIEDLLNGH